MASLESLMLYNYSNHPYAHTTVVETSIVSLLPYIPYQVLCNHALT